MKISAYHKAQGDIVKWYLPLEHYDKVYASKVFTDSDFEPKPNMIIGGSGYEKTKKLPQEIDDIKPDYSIYPDCDYSIGYTTRGCIRKCEFCFVPEMEGKIYEYRKVADVWRGQGDLVLLDNNILAMPNKFIEVLGFCETNQIHVDFNQGLDCRLVTKNIADLINKKRKRFTTVRFAFDNLSYIKSVYKTCELLNGSCFWYVYCDEWENALERLLILKRLGQRPYLMRDKSVRGQKKYNYLANWTNRQMLFQKLDIYDYFPIYHSVQQQRAGQLALEFE
ncbi:MAG TPA: hypothetical protein VMV56_08825 [Williamwhitmania sp.]|nr:hypothetical protein [Williamwhitmania sp.]